MKTAKEILRAKIIEQCTDDYEGTFQFYENAVIEAMETHTSQFRPSSESIKVAMEKARAFTILSQSTIGKISWEEFCDHIAWELGGGVNLPLNLAIWKKAQSMNYSDFAKWFNEKLENNTPPTK